MDEFGGFIGAGTSNDLHRDIDSVEEAERRRPRHRPYYEDLGRSHDMILRCKDCRRLVTYDEIQRGGCCPHCSNRRLLEVRSLSVWEWFKIRVGLVRFPDRKLFLAEFKSGR